MNTFNFVTPPEYKDIPVRKYSNYFSPELADVSGYKTIALIGKPATGKTTVCKGLIEWINAPQTTVVTGSMDDWGDYKRKNVEIFNAGVLPTIKQKTDNVQDIGKILNEASKAVGNATRLIFDILYQQQNDINSLRERLIILDDVSNQLKSKGTAYALDAILRQVRHYKVHVIVVAHTPWDIASSVRGLFRYNIITGLNVTGSPIQKRDTLPYFHGLLNKKTMPPIVARLVKDEAMVVVKSSYNPVPDVLDLLGTLRPFKKLDNEEAALEWFKTDSIAIIIKSELFKQ